MTRMARSRCLLPLLPFFWLAEPVRADDGVPALLRFAEQYHSQALSGDKAPLSEKTSANVAPVTSGELALRQALTAHEAQLARQRATLQAQERQLGLLNKALNQAQAQLREQSVLKPAEKNADARHTKPADFTPLMQLVARLRQAAGGTPDEARAAALIKEARVETAQAQAALSNSQAQVRALEAHMVVLKQRLGVKERQVEKMRDEEKGIHEKNVSDLKAQLDALQRLRGESDARVATLEQERLHLQEATKQLRERAKFLARPEALKQLSGQQNYAAGAALGREIIEMLDERKGWGVDADRQTILAGVIDAFIGQYQLTPDVLDKALAESEVLVNKARVKAGATQKKKGQDFVAGFKKLKDTQQSPSGFWYRVGYVGDSTIAADAIVDVVVKESLTDGTVIQDMDLSGKVLSQPLEAYPPLFREAIGYLRNHGSVTLVVPPELAYGEAGYPPKIPPHATMIYELRVEDAKASAGK
ncbi:FKBP-type peptidyl-prolyl cis-trans isomerase N-terminal domain-containing protein [Serratia marcescens]|uniref:FKBP-type peptidyl-prolyl cis-trans isomerase N-terminal domain-containing protein n=1 Tax=Serratia TaxID=613 RepID=UPI003BA01E59